MTIAATRRRFQSDDWARPRPPRPRRSASATCTGSGRRMIVRLSSTAAASHGHAAEDEGEDVPAAERRSDAPEGRAEEEAAHLGRAVEPERGPALRGRRGVEDVGPRGRVVGGGREAGEGPGEQEGRDAGQDERHRDHDSGRQEAGQHQEPLVAAIGEPAEERLAQEARGRPGRDDPAQGRGVDPLLRDVERQDRQERAEAHPEDGLGDQDGEDRERPGKPPADTPGAGVGHAAIVPSRRSPRTRGRGRSGRPSPPSRPGRRRASGPAPSWSPMSRIGPVTMTRATDWPPRS